MMSNPTTRFNKLIFLGICMSSLYTTVDKTFSHAFGVFYILSGSLIIKLDLMPTT